MDTSPSKEVKTPQHLKTRRYALVPLNIFQLIFKFPGDVPNAPQRAGLPVLVQEVGLFGREVAFYSSHTSPVRRTFYKSVGPSAHIRTI